jgi:hypothetical protein
MPHVPMPTQDAEFMALYDAAPARFRCFTPPHMRQLNIGFTSMMGATVGYQFHYHNNEHRGGFLAS